jgi:hypothetical protein
MSSNVFTGSDTFVIPDGEVNPRAYASPYPNDTDPVLKDRDPWKDSHTDPNDRQLYHYIQALERIHNREDIVVQNQRNPLAKDSINGREAFMMNLYAKHKNLPEGTNNVARKQKVFQPNKVGVSRSDLHQGDAPALGNNFQNLFPGDVWSDKVRRHLKNNYSNNRDGRVTSDNIIVDSFSTGQEVAAKQSVWQAIRSRGEAKAFEKWDLEARKAVRNIYSLPGRAIAVDWQGPNANHHDAGTNTRHGRRMGGTGKSFGTRGLVANFFHEPHKRPDNINMRSVQNKIVPSRPYVTGEFLVERPQIQTMMQRKMKPKVFAMRTQNVSDIDTFAQDPSSQREGAFETTHTPIVSGTQQPTRWAVGEDRGFKQDHIAVSGAENRAVDTGDYTRRYGANNNEQNEDQRSFTFTQHLNKPALVREPARILTHRDPLLPDARHQDMYRL